MTNEERAALWRARQLQKAGVTPPKPKDSIARFSNGIARDPKIRAAEARQNRLCPEGWDRDYFETVLLRDAAYVAAHKDDIQAYMIEQRADETDAMMERAQANVEESR